MNKFVILAVVIVVAVCNAQDRPRSDDMKKLIDTCKAETSATDADVKAFIARQPFTNKSGWCMMGCIKKKMGVLTSANKIDMDKLKVILQEMQNPDMYKKMVAIMQQCSDLLASDPKNSADQCSAAQVFGTCYYSKRTAAGF